MAADSLNNLMRNRETIRRIMAMDSNGKMDKMLENAVHSGVVSYNQDGVTYMPSERQGMNSGKVIVNEEVMKQSRMPKAVLESFKKNPGASTEMPKSVLDGLGLETLQAMRNESVSNEPVQQPAGNVNIDYSLLRTIINEAVQENVKKYISALSKKLLSESVNVGGNSVQAVKLGKNFSFITENGDVYEATLSYKTNLNEQTKKGKKETKK